MTVTDFPKASGTTTALQRATVLSHPKATVPLARIREDLIMRLVRKLPALPFSVLIHARFHRRLSLFRQPKRYSELVNRKKIYDHNPLLTKTADKYEVREYVATTIGSQYLIPMQQVVDRPEDIEWDVLRGQVVIKGTHGCNMTMVLDADAQIDRAHVMQATKKWLATNWYNVWKEWAYRDISPRLIIENFIGKDGIPPADYKFHVFNGRVEMIQVDTDRFKGHKSMLFTPDWNKLDVGVAFGEQEETPTAPQNIEEMIRLAQALAQPFEYVRVDFYNVDGRIYFGEITHYPGAASVKFHPQSFDDALGELWRNGTPIPERYVVAR